MELKQSTAFNRSFDFTGTAITGVTVTISKDGGAFGALAGAVNYVGGTVVVLLAAGDTDTLGSLAYSFVDSILGAIVPNGDAVDLVVSASVPDVNVVSVAGDNSWTAQFIQWFSSIYASTVSSTTGSFTTVNVGSAITDTRFVGGVIYFVDGNNAGAARIVTAQVPVGGEFIATFDAALPHACTAGDRVFFFGRSAAVVSGTVDANIVTWLGTAPVALTPPGFPQVDAQYIGGAATMIGPMVQYFNGLSFLTVTTAGFSATTTTFELTDITGVDRYTGSVFKFLGGPPGKCFTRVKSFSFPAGRARLVVDPPLPAAPGNGDTFLHDGLDVGQVTALADAIISDSTFTEPVYDDPIVGPLGRILRLFRYRFVKRINDKVAGRISMKKNDGTTELTGMDYTSTPGADTIQDAS